MPLCEKVRIEIFIPNPPNTKYRDLLEELAAEFSFTFGGCTEVPASGKYHSLDGLIVSDRINILFSDAPLLWQRDRLVLGKYVETVRRAAMRALTREEAILVGVYPVCHVE